MEVVGIKFRNNCKTYYFSPNGLKLNVADKVVVETPNGNTIAEVSEQNKDIDPETLVAPLSNVVRRATNSDIKTMEKLDSRRGEVIKTKIEKYFPEASKIPGSGYILKLLPSYGGDWEQYYEIRMEWKK